MTEQMVNQDINFQPTTQGYSYSNAPQEKKKRLNTFYVLIYLSISFSIIFAFLLGVLNFYNILPLSSMYPKVFAPLPHQYDITRNEKSLANVMFSQDYDGFYLEGTLIYISLGKDRIIVKHKGEIAEFILATNLKCEKMITTKLSSDVERISNINLFCDDLLKRENVDKQVNIVYQKTPNGIYLLEKIAVKDTK